MSELIPVISSPRAQGIEATFQESSSILFDLDGIGCLALCVVANLHSDPPDAANLRCLGRCITAGQEKSQ